MSEIYILGIGRNSINILELAIDCGFTIGGLYHFDSSKTGEDYFGFQIKGSFDDILRTGNIKNKNFALSMGNVEIKASLYNEIKERGGVLPTLIHPSCFISRYAKIEEGVQLLPHCVVEGDSFIGYDTAITVNSVIAHSVHIGNHNLISGNVMIGAYCNIGNFTHIGQGSVVVSGKADKIGDHCILGAGSVLLTEMPDTTVFAGNPAKFLRYNK